MTPRSPSAPRQNAGSRPVKGAPYTARGPGGDPQLAKQHDAIYDASPGKRSSTPEWQKESFDLPRLKGAQANTTSPTSLKQDAINQKMKWTACPKVGPMPEKLLTLADELWRLAEDQKNAGEPESWVPDPRTRNIREQLLKMAEALASGDLPARPATHTGERERSSEDAPTRPTTPLSTEVSKLRQELADSQTKINALEAARQADPNMEAARLKDELIDNKSRLASLEATSQNVSIGQNVQLRRALEEQTAKVLKMEKALIAHIAAREKRKSREAWLRQYGLVGRMMLNDTMSSLLVCSGWSNQVANDRCDRQLENARRDRKYLAARLRESIFALAQSQQEGTRLGICFCTWVALIDEAKGLSGTAAMAKAVRKRMQQVIGRMFAGNALADLADAFGLWRAAVREAGAQIEARAQVKAAQEESVRMKKELLDKFGEKAMYQSNRKIKEFNNTRLQEALSAWLKLYDEYKAERALKEEMVRAKAEAAATRAKAVQMALGTNAGALVQDVWTVWKEGYIADKACGRTGKRKEQAMKTAMRDIMKTEEAFRKAVFSAWAQVVTDEKVAAQLGSIQAQMSMVANARKRALNMIDARGKKALEALLPEIIYNWANCKKIATQRQEAMNRAMRNISQSTEQLMNVGFMAWAKLAGDDREINQERGRRRRMAETSRSIVIKLRGRLQLRVAFDGWLIRTLL